MLSKQSVSTSRSLYIVAAAVALLACAVYVPALQHQFVDWDDGTYVFDNPNIQNLDLHLLTWSFFHFYAANWHPLTWLSHAVDWALWGPNPFGHHLSNVLLHAVNSALVSVFTWRLVTIARPLATGSATRTAPLVAAGVAGTLFGLHPIHVESVAWVAERKDLLCALFSLLSLLAYIGRHEESPCEAVPALHARPTILSLALFALALLSKPMAVTLPLVLLLLGWYPLGQINSPRDMTRAAVAKLPFFALSAGSAVVTVLAQKAGGSLNSLSVVPAEARFAMAGKALFTYLVKMVAPVDLLPFYPYPTAASLYSWPTFAAIAVVTATTITCIVKARSNRLWLALWASYVITLLPVLGLVQVGRQSMADRYAYLPGIALFILAGLGAAVWAERWPSGRKAAVTATAIVGIAFGIATVHQLRMWKDSITLWNVIIESTPKKLDFAYNNRAIAWHRLGRLDKSAEDFASAIEANPNDSSYLNNRGIVLMKLKRYEEAESMYQKAITLNPNSGGAYYNMACILSLRNQTKEACDSFRKSIEHGYTSWQDIKVDHDLDNIRSAACYQEMMAGK